MEEHSTEEEEEAPPVSNKETKSICQMWTKCQDLFERHHPNRTVTGRILDMMNVNVVSHFRKIL